MKNNKKQNIKKAAVLFISFTLIVNANLVAASEITASKMVELTNESRIESGLASLTTNNKLEQAAKAKAADMLANQYFEHTSPEGVTPWYWFNQAGYEYIYAAENLAIDFITAEGAHSALMKSTGHRENILGTSYKEVGIAVVSGEFKGNSSILIVEEFGSQREHKITVNNAPFFETVTEIKAEVKPPVKVMVEDKVQPKKESLTAKAETSVAQSETQEVVDVIPAVKEDTKKDSENDIFHEDIEMQSATIGKVIPKVYSIKNVQQLKKVYVEDIYWESAEEEGLLESLDSNTLKLKIFIRDLTGGLL